ncbi:restriction endonuclease subunit S [Streptococcus equi]|uniref:restriction endonuclease subunit S n=1 Tax=Streptococcus equi TaxID=1336 RepID=UPI001E2BD958|nr:restriction endonuclease subunit S [Streptococcus equi]MCD3426588.1 restriction endonuclease subunit S [Streptococcus equi subsp. zooepidemicus]HEL0566293.1 restriction endonuclease subunit S [Streptococcus equi subsp. zooepidemicus]HEL0650765.1 restriction endonuclease subunit S [Streptococcus equi subsp. zooepidemicus]HEL1238541.1 restriction endonuclease subunit S [Streptococcus equi subsp. zooepidemicus]
MKLGEVCDSISVTFDKTKQQVVLVNTSDVFNGKVTNHALVDNKGLKGQFKKTFQKGDILYSEIRPKNKRFAFIDFNANDYVASTKLMVIRANKKVLPQYLYQVLKSEEVINQLQSLAESRSGTFPQITFSELAQIDARIPELAEQKEIADFLKLFDDKIELNNKINHHLEELAQAIFKSWFIDFEPFDGIKPSDWEIASLTDIADYLNGLAMQKFRPEKDENSLPVLKIKELRQGAFDKTSDICSANIKPEYIINDGDVIFSWSGSLLVDFWTGGIGGLNQHLFKVSSQNYDKWFYYSWTKYYLQEFINIAADKATTMGHITRSSLENAKILIPNAKDYEMISSILVPIYDDIIQNRIASRKLAQLRDEILPKLLSGELSINYNTK